MDDLAEMSMSDFEFMVHLQEEYYEAKAKAYEDAKDKSSGSPDKVNTSEQMKKKNMVQNVNEQSPL